MVATGISLRVVQDIGGWSTLRMLERYTYPSGAEMSRAVRVLTPYRHKSRHSAEKRSPRVEEARSRKWCEIGSCDLASPTGTGVSYHADFQRIWVSDGRLRRRSAGRAFYESCSSSSGSGSAIAASFRFGFCGSGARVPAA